MLRSRCGWLSPSQADSEGSIPFTRSATWVPPPRNLRTGYRCDPGSPFLASFLPDKGTDARRGTMPRFMDLQEQGKHDVRARHRSFAVAAAVSAVMGTLVVIAGPAGPAHAVSHRVLVVPRDFAT